MKNIKNKSNITWKKLIIFAVISGIYTSIMAMLPIVKDTSLADISISFEVWILFGILIIMHSKTAKDSALKCFIFFLISQPIVYLLQVPFNSMGWGIFGYYKYWFVWTILTLPMGFIGWYMKRNKWWSLLILLPILMLLGFQYYSYLKLTLYSFPNHLLSTIFCIITMVLYPVFIFKNRKVKVTGCIISIVILLIASLFALMGDNTYNTAILSSGGSEGVTFDDSYNVYLEDSSYGEVYIEYDEEIEDYLVKAKFKKTGKTNIILEDTRGNKLVYEIDIKNNTYEIKKKEDKIQEYSEEELKEMALDYFLTSVEEHVDKDEYSVSLTSEVPEKYQNKNYVAIEIRHLHSGRSALDARYYIYMKDASGYDDEGNKVNFIK